MGGVGRIKAKTGIKNPSKNVSLSFLWLWFEIFNFIDKLQGGTFFIYNIWKKNNSNKYYPETLMSSSPKCFFLCIFFTAQ